MSDYNELADRGRTFISDAEAAVALSDHPEKAAIAKHIAAAHGHLAKAVALTNDTGATARRDGDDKPDAPVK